MADIVAELVDDRSRLDALSQSGDERAAVRAVFDWSYQQLSPEHARLFRRLGLHPGPEMSLEAAAAVAELCPADTRRLLVVLTEAHLIEPMAGGRYRFHDLLRAYAAEQTNRYDAFADRQRAMDDLLSWYAHTAQTADRQLYPVHLNLVGAVAEPVHPHLLPTRAHAWSWVQAERANLLAALYCADKHSLDRHVFPLAGASRFLGMTGNWQDLVDTVKVGWSAAKRCGDRLLEAVFLLRRGTCWYSLRQWDSAHADCNQALDIALALNHDLLRAWALNDRGLVYLYEKKFLQALNDLDIALPLSVGDRTGRLRAVIEGNLSVAYSGLGEFRQALEYGQRGLSGRRAIGDYTGEASALKHVARAWQGLGDHAAAIGYCRDAIKVGRSVSAYRYQTIAEPLEVLAASLHRLGRVDEACACRREAAEIYDEYGLSQDAADVRQRLAEARNSA